MRSAARQSVLERKRSKRHRAPRFCQRQYVGTRFNGNEATGPPYQTSHEYRLRAAPSPFCGHSIRQIWSVASSKPNSSISAGLRGDRDRHAISALMLHRVAQSEAGSFTCVAWPQMTRINPRAKAVLPTPNRMQKIKHGSSSAAASQLATRVLAASSTYHR